MVRKRGYLVDMHIFHKSTDTHLHDHMAMSQWWNEGKLRDALALGYPNLVPAFAKGTSLMYSMDWIISQPVPHKGLKTALAKDGGKIDDLHPVLSSPRSWLELLLFMPPQYRWMEVTSPQQWVVGLQPTYQSTANVA